MAHPAMKERHWDRIAKTTGHTFDFEAENFMLRNIMEAPLLKNKEDIEVCIRVRVRMRVCTVCDAFLCAISMLMKKTGKTSYSLNVKY